MAEFIMPIIGTRPREQFVFTPTKEDREQALKNHSRQSLERLKERGGVNWNELAAILEHRPFKALNESEAKDYCLTKGKLL